MKPVVTFRSDDARPAARYAQALAVAVAEQRTPLTPEDEQDCVQRCLRSAKTKAELLRKALPYAATHAQCLGVVAAVCGG